MFIKRKGKHLQRRNKKRRKDSRPSGKKEIPEKARGLRLSRSERREIQAAVERARNSDPKKKSAQESITYEQMWPDGICRVKQNYYTKAILFQDINYQLAQNEDKTAIFDGWCDFLNYFDSSMHFQLSFLNIAFGRETVEFSINIPLKGDALDSD